WLIDEPLSSLDPVRLQQAMRALVDCARERSVTLVTTLHQVDAALAYFPRVIGLRKGRMVFDLPSSQVTTAQLASLYESSEESLQVDLRVDPVGNVTALHCR
ncbi:MAG: phosphonate ABC transporter, partial [Betaproteobacteria bacterium]|nr:phosphonate ABC transporter [Betaproteobacteria bacterium]